MGQNISCTDKDAVNIIGSDGEGPDKRQTLKDQESRQTNEIFNHDMSQNANSNAQGRYTSATVIKQEAKESNGDYNYQGQYQEHQASSSPFSLRAPSTIDEDANVPKESRGFSTTTTKHPNGVISYCDHQQVVTSLFSQQAKSVKQPKLINGNMNLHQEHASNGSLPSKIQEDINKYRQLSSAFPISSAAETDRRKIYQQEDNLSLSDVMENQLSSHNKCATQRNFSSHQQVKNFKNTRVAETKHTHSGASAAPTKIYKEDLDIAKKQKLINQRRREQRSSSSSCSSSELPVYKCASKPAPKHNLQPNNLDADEMLAQRGIFLPLSSTMLEQSQYKQEQHKNPLNLRQKATNIETNSTNTTTLQANISKPVPSTFSEQQLLQSRIQELQISNQQEEIPSISSQSWNATQAGQQHQQQLDKIQQQILQSQLAAFAQTQHNQQSQLQAYYMIQQQQQQQQQRLNGFQPQFTFTLQQHQVNPYLNNPYSMGQQYIPYQQQYFPQQLNMNMMNINGFIPQQQQQAHQPMQNSNVFQQSQGGSAIKPYEQIIQQQQQQQQQMQPSFFQAGQVQYQMSSNLPIEAQMRPSAVIQHTNNQAFPIIINNNLIQQPEQVIDRYSSTQLTMKGEDSSSTPHAISEIQVQQTGYQKKKEREKKPSDDLSLNTHSQEEKEVDASDYKWSQLQRNKLRKGCPQDTPKDVTLAQTFYNRNGGNSSEEYWKEKDEEHVEYGVKQVEEQDNVQSAQNGQSLAEIFEKKRLGRFNNQKKQQEQEISAEPLQVRPDKSTNKRTKEEIIKLRNEMKEYASKLNPKLKAKSQLKQHQEQQQVHFESETQKGGIGGRVKSPTYTKQQEDLMMRLASGAKSKISEKEMYALTRKNYENLPEVKLKKQEMDKQINKNEVLKIKQEKLKELDDKRRGKYKQKIAVNSSSQKSILQTPHMMSVLSIQDNLYCSEIGSTMLNV